MLILQDNVVSYRLEESNNSSSQRVNEIRDEDFRCGSNADPDSVGHEHRFFRDTLMELKRVAIDPCSDTASSLKVRESEHQIFKAREVLTLSTDCPQRKRKLDKLERTVRENVIASYSPSKPSKKSRVQSFTEREKSSLASSSSCLINRADSAESSGQIFRSSERSSKFDDRLSKKLVANGLDLANPSNKEVFILFDSDDSVSGSNLPSPKKSVPQSSQRNFKLLNSGNGIPKQRVPTSSPKIGGPRLVSSLSLASKKQGKHQKPQRSVKLTNFGDYLPRMAIPVGPRFQADIPDWTGLPNRDRPLNGEVNSFDSDKWLGTRIWPTECSDTEISTEIIGKGRPCSCSCKSPGSTTCIKRHISEKRLTLQRDLSSVFFSWKVDEMGEEVSKSWTSEEQKSFRYLVKTNPVSKDTSFWKPALERFACKTRVSIVNYYFNVFVLRRMSRQTRLASTIVDSDDDEEANDSAGSGNDPKARYLTGLR